MAGEAAGGFTHSIPVFSASRSELGNFINWYCWDALCCKSPSSFTFKKTGTIIEKGRFSDVLDGYNVHFQSKILLLNNRSESPQDI